MRCRQASLSWTVELLPQRSGIVAVFHDPAGLQFGDDQRDEVLLGLIELRKKVESAAGS